MAAVMIVQSALIYQVENGTSISHQSGIGAAAMLFIFQGAFTIGFQATVWVSFVLESVLLPANQNHKVYPSEILPLRLRQRGSSISTASNWICNYLIVQITPPAISNIGWRTYIIFAILNTLWVPIIYFFFPETKGSIPSLIYPCNANEMQAFSLKMSIGCSLVSTRKWQVICSLPRVKWSTPKWWAKHWLESQRTTYEGVTMYSGILCLSDSQSADSVIPSRLRGKSSEVV